MIGGRSMSDNDMHAAERQNEAMQPGGISPGGMLRAARQAQNMHIEALAVALKVPVAKLEALEADRYDALPDAVFVRALASSVCRSLKIDPKPVLALMPQSGTPSLAGDSAGINAAFKDGSEKGRAGDIVSRAMNPAFLVAMALVLGAIAILAFFPGSSVEVQPAGKAPVMHQDGLQPAPATAEPASLTAASAPVEGVFAMGVASSAVQGPVPEVASATALPAPPASSASDSAVGAEVGAALLAFRARSESWIQVRDASGATTFQRVVAAGETVVAPGKPPFSVVVGKADGTEVIVRGKVFDLVPVSRDNVARFEVKP